ncbi:hypothetical protein CMK11_11580 [Candidatus Poribacteria bacterium]|nr:hypothetical protein [Candidatus Poribacteria bacterium]
MKTPEQVRLEQGMRFIQIPGPNPILCPAEEPEAWDSSILECCGVLRDGASGWSDEDSAETYYLYYHARTRDADSWGGRAGYRLGVASAPHPLGPWTKHDGNPVIDLGDEGSWEDGWVACAAVLKEGEDSYYMWYNGNGYIGLATATHPLGPWTKHPDNPVHELYSYIGGVVQRDGKYYMYAEYPIGENSPDQGPFVLLTAERPEGPWTAHDGLRPVLAPDGWGTWEDGGYSESGVLYHDDMFHMFYGATKWHKLESIGYAYSFDGVDWHKHHGNPVGDRHRDPDANAFAEVHTLWEPPFYYVYHTLRYVSKGGEDLGVQVFATETPFRLTMPLLSVPRLEAGASTSLAECPAVSLERASWLSIEVSARYVGDSCRSPVARVKGSSDGVSYNTEDLATFDLPARADETVSATFPLAPDAMFVKVAVENPSQDGEILDVVVSATLGAA